MQKLSEYISAHISSTFLKKKIFTWDKSLELNNNKFPPSGMLYVLPSSISVESLRFQIYSSLYCYTPISLNNHKAKILISPFHNVHSTILPGEKELAFPECLGKTETCSKHNHGKLHKANSAWHPSQMWLQISTPHIFITDTSCSTYQWLNQSLFPNTEPTTYPQILY